MPYGISDVVVYDFSSPDFSESMEDPLKLLLWLQSF